MPRRRSAGIVLYRVADGGPEVLLVHPGGPFWAKKDLGAWSIPRASTSPTRTRGRAALREFEEETGTRLRRATSWSSSARCVQKGGKEVTAWAARGDLDAAARAQQQLRDGVAAALGAPRRSSPRSTAPSGSRSTRRGAKLVAAQVELLDRLVERVING